MEFCTFASGSSGNCSLVSCRGTLLLIDAGISMKRIKTDLAAVGAAPEMLSGILVTHEHSDHICALKMLTKYYDVPVFAPRGVAWGIRLQMPEVAPSICEFEAGTDFDIGSISVSSFNTPHDTRESVGYRLTGGGRTLSIVTDLGYIPQEVFDTVLGSDTVLLESNHDVDMLKSGSYPPYLKRRILGEHGHLSNSECARMAAALAKRGTKRIILAHLSRENNTPDKAFSTVEDALCSCGGGVELCVAPAAVPSRRYNV